MVIAFITPFSEAGASTNRTIQLSRVFEHCRLIILPQEDKYGFSPYHEDYYFPLQKKSFWQTHTWLLNSVKKLFEKKPEVVYFVKPHPFTLFPALFYKYTRGCFLVFDCDEWDPATLQDNDEGLLKIMLTDLLASVSMWAANLIVYSNRLLLVEKIPSKYVGKSYYIPNGVDTELFTPLSEKHTTCNIMYVGMLWKIRHILPLVDAMEKVDPKITCTIVGGGPRLNELKNIIAKHGLYDRFKFRGGVDHIQLPNILAKADICLAPFDDLPGIRYQSNIKVFEYLACGKPVVATDVGELAQVLDGVGEIIKPGDAEALALAINTLSQKDLSVLSVRAREKAVREYDWMLQSQKLKQAIDMGIEQLYTKDARCFEG